VIMENNRACQIDGIDTVCIKMFDGAVRELIEVRCVP